MVQAATKGFVYVLINQALPGCVKIGKTTRDSTTRAAELSSATGVPTPFLVAFEAYFENCHDAEAYIHTVLESEGVRLASNREFFSITTSHAINAVIKAQRKFGIDSLSALENNAKDAIATSEALPAQEPWEQVFEEAEDYYYGFGEKLEDKEKALALFKTAAKLGSGEAYVRLGNYYGGTVGFDWIKRGANAEHLECFLEMANIFRGEEIIFKNVPINLENARKAYCKFFEIVNISKFENELLFFSLKNYLDLIDGKPNQFDFNALKKFLSKFKFHIDEMPNKEDGIAKNNQLDALCKDYIFNCYYLFSLENRIFKNATLPIEAIFGHLHQNRRKAL